MNILMLLDTFVVLNIRSSALVRVMHIQPELKQLVAVHFAVFKWVSSISLQPKFNSVSGVCSVVPTVVKGTHIRHKVNHSSACMGLGQTLSQMPPTSFKLAKLKNIHVKAVRLASRSPPLPKCWLLSQLSAFLEGPVSASEPIPGTLSCLGV